MKDGKKGKEEKGRKWTMADGLNKADLSFFFCCVFVCLEIDHVQNGISCGKAPCTHATAKEKLCVSFSPACLPEDNLPPC